MSQTLLYANQGSININDSQFINNTNFVNKLGGLYFNSVE